MAKDRKKLQHIHSSIPDKQPIPASLEVGEIAVNNAANQEFLSIKNSQNKVKRFSSDEQNITWMEKKEVMPYEGYTRGADGPAGTTGPDSVKRSDLLENKSNIIIKLNQVAASNTVKHDKVNGAKDIYGKCVNPTSDSGVTDGAGFAIDMSRYAMLDANPGFSALTVTDQTNLQGNTIIENGTGTGKYADTNTGHTLTIKTTDVVATDTNWTETITNKTETITTEVENISGRTTTIGNSNEVLHVIGTTTETHDKAVTITNNNNVTETTNGNVVENVSGTTTINHSGNTTTNESGNTVFNTTGDTTLNTNGSTTIQSTGNGSDVTIYAKDDLCATSDDVAAFKGTNKTNIGIDCSDAGQTQTLNVRANTADTRVTSAYTSATTATTIINTANTSATTATLSGDTLSIIENDTDIKSCGRISATTNDFEVKQCTANGKVVINSDDIDISGKTLDIIENSSTTIKSPETTISGCSKVEIISDDLNLRPCTSAGTIDFNFCNGFSVESNKVSIEQCDADGTLTVKEKATTISGTTLDILEKDEVEIVGDNKVHIGGETVEVACDLFDVDADSNVCIESDDKANFYGANDTKVGVSCTNQLSKSTVIDSLSGTVVSSNSDTCVYGKNVNIGGDVRTRIGANCQGAVDSSYVEISANTAITESAPTIGISGNTTNISGASNVNISGASITENGTNVYISGTTSTNISGGSITEVSTGKTCIQAGTDLNIGGYNNTKIGANCDGEAYSQNTTIYATTAVTINTPKTNITGDTYLSGKTYFNNTCESIDSNELSDALCEVFDRSEVTWKTGDYAATDENLKWYELWQNGAQLKDQNGNAVRIDIPKDHILKDASIVYGKANGSSFTACTSTSTDCHWYIKLVWNVFNPSTGHSDDKTVYLPADDFVTDIDDDNSNTDRGVNVNVWYDGKQNWVSATTSIKIAAPSGDKPFTRSNGNHSLTSYKLSYSHNGFSGEFDPFNANSSFTSPHSALSWTYESVTGETGSSYDTSAKKSFKIPKNLKHLVNDLDDLTIQYGTNVSNRTSSTTYDGSAANTVDVPTTLAQISDSHVKDSSPSTATGTITIDKNTNVSKALTVSSGLTVSNNGAKISGDTSISGGTLTTTTTGTTQIKANSNAYIAGSGTTYVGEYLDDDYEYSKYVEVCATSGVSIDARKGFIKASGNTISMTGTTTISGNVSVSGTITATQAIYSSDRNLKENIKPISRDDINKVGKVLTRSFNFKDDDTKRKTYGVIAQDVLDAGIGEIVHTGEDGMLGVDYTSLLILKIAYLEAKLSDLEEKIKENKN